MPKETPSLVASIASRLLRSDLFEAERIVNSIIVSNVDSWHDTQSPSIKESIKQEIDNLHILLGTLKDCRTVAASVMSQAEVDTTLLDDNNDQTT